LKNQRLFIYAAYKQQYLEYIEHHEIQKAFAHLNKRLKPLEHLQTNPNEFRDLCYLLTARSVHEAPSFKNWEGIMAGREQLIEHFQSLYEFETLNAQTSQYVPNHRLMTLLRQAIAYQVHSSRHIPKVPPKINTLLEDYTAFLVPNVKKTIFKGHAANVKCVDFVGEMGHSIVSGSSDHLGIVWNIQTGEIESHLEGHTSRIWDVASNKVGDLIATGSADRTVKLWSFSSGWSNACTFSEHEGDVYSVKFHPGQRHLLTGGYDRTLRLFDIEKQTLVKSFSGHGLSISKCVFTPLGNLIVSGSKDSTIRFWDLVSGLCVRTISSHLGEVTSVEMSQNGLLLLSSSKDNSNRLWDVRMVILSLAHGLSYDPLNDTRDIRIHLVISFVVVLLVIHWYWEVQK
jgi:COMPASS component SWD3